MDRTTQLRKRRLMLGLAAGVPLLIVAILVVVLARTFSSGGSGASGSGSPPVGGRASNPEDVAELMDRARQRLKQNEPAAAESILRTALELQPGDQDLRTLYGETLLSLARPKDAYLQYEQAIAIGPDSAELRFAAGTVASVAGMPDRAEEHYARAQQLAPTNPKHPLYLGQIQRKLGRVDEAKASLMRAAKLDPDLAIAWGALASIELDQNHLSVAKGLAKRAREAEPRAVAWRLLEAKILRREGKPEDAVRLLMALDTADRLSDPNVLDELGMCYGLLKRPSDAANLFADAVEKNPKDADLLYQTAFWYDKADVKDAALIYAGRAADLGHDGAKKLAEKLRK